MPTNDVTSGIVLQKRRTLGHGTKMTACWEKLLESNTGMSALLKDVQSKQKSEECVINMVQRAHGATLMDVQIKLNKEECVISMVQSASGASQKHAQKLLRKEACALGTG
jgi:isocitrate lyase